MREIPKFLTIVSILIFVGGAMWWLESRFSASVAVMVIGTLVGALFFAGGALLSHMIQKSTLHNVTQFAQRDAQTDRYRMASFKALAQGESAMQRAAAQLTVIDAKRIDSLAQQRAHLLTDTERQAARDVVATNDVWTWEDSDQDAGATFAVWE